MSATITVVIPTYRRPALLRRAIDSVLGQTWSDLVVSVFDNASGDDTESVVAAAAARDPRVRYHRHPENLGAVRNFQAGMDSVDTPWFCLLSDDDLLLPGFLRHAMERLASAPQAAFFCGQTVRFDPDEGTHEARPVSDWSDGFHEAGSATTRMLRTMFTWTGVVFSRRVREAAGPFETIAIADLLFMAKAAARLPFVVSLVPCAVRVHWPESALRRLTAEQVAEVYDVTAARMAALPELPAGEAQEIAGVLARMRRRALGLRLKAAFSSGDWEACRRAGALLGSEPDRPWSWRARLALAATPAGRAFAAPLAPLLESIRRRRRAGRGVARGATLDEVVRLYGSRLPA